MRSRRQVARDITYSHSDETKGGHPVIHFMENATGRLRLIRHAGGCEQEVVGGRDFRAVMVERYGLKLEVAGEVLDAFPPTAPWS